MDWRASGTTCSKRAATPSSVSSAAKLLGYALGREVQLSDEPLLTEIEQRLARNDYRFSVAVEMIVQSRQFREIRGRQAPLAE